MNITDIVIAKALAGGGGGGGGGDFSTAEVTFKVIGENAPIVYAAFLNAEDEFTFGDMSVNNNSSATILLYKSKAYMSAYWENDAYIPSGSNIIEDDGDYYIIGNGEITLTAE